MRLLGPVEPAIASRIWKPRVFFQRFRKHCKPLAITEVPQAAITATRTAIKGPHKRFMPFIGKGEALSDLPNLPAVHSRWRPRQRFLSSMPKVKKRLVLGVTGGIASGKSTVMSLLRQAGIPTISSDELAHSCISRGTSAYRAILRYFGVAILSSHREIDRKKLGQIVFAHRTKRKHLERIVHPCVVKGLSAFINRHSKGVIALDIPLLFEAKLQSLIDTIVVVYSPRELQIRRLISRNGLSRREATQRLFAQLSMNHKRKRADILLDNSGTLDSLRDQIQKKLLTLKGPHV